MIPDLRAEVIGERVTLPGKKLWGYSSDEMKCKQIQLGACNKDLYKVSKHTALGSEMLNWNILLNR
jgi:hypothetical protein